MFGSTRPSLFGSNANTSFGSAGITFGGAASTPFGNANSSMGFGTGTFGTQPAPGSLFSAPTNPAPSGGLFGGGTGSVFGQQQQPSTFAFGQASVATTAASASGGGLFSNTSAGFGGSSLFGGGSGGQSSAFGAAAPASSVGPGLFGATGTGTNFMGAATGTGGTTIKFVPATGTDVVMKNGSQQSVQTKLQCITGMKEYENKSLEELRVEDYLANRKGPQAGAFGLGAPSATPGFAGFGAKPATASFGGFGATSTSAGGTMFGAAQPSTGMFGGFGAGTTAAKPLFGAPTATTASTPFGGLSTAGTSLFGSNNQNKGLFGPTATTQPSSLFGQSQQATPAFGGFGATPTPFGASTAQTGTSLFGAARPTGFGQPSTGLFGTTPQPANTGLTFGQPSSQPLFGGGTSSGGGLFGNKPATTSTTFTGFGATATPFSFSTPASSTAGPFGAAFGSNTSSLFGNKTTTTPAFGFGATQPGFQFTNSTLGGAGGAGSTWLTPSVGTTGQPAVDPTAAAIAQHNQMQLMQLASSPYGDSPLFRNLLHDAPKREDLLKPTSPAAQKAALAAGTQSKIGSRPTARIKPKPLQSLAAGGKGQLFDGLEEDESSFEGDTFQPRRSVRKLVIKTSSRQSTSNRSNSPPLILSGDDVVDQGSNGRLAGEQANRNREQQEWHRNSTQPSNGELQPNRSHSSPHDNTIGELNSRNRLINNDRGLFDDSPARDSPAFARDGYSHALGRNGTAGSGNGRRDSSSEPDDQSSCLSETDQPPHPSGLVLRRHGYYTLPSVEEIQRNEDGRWFVPNFVVGRAGYGNVMFHGVTDVEGLNLDEIVHFRRKEIMVYPNDETKPPVGQGLNKKAQVTLDCCWPLDKTTGKVIKDCDRLEKMGYCDKLERTSYKIGAKFLDFRPETGSWVFEVEHFSKYGLLDDSDEEEVVVGQQLQNLKQLQMMQQQKKQPLQQQSGFDQKKQVNNTIAPASQMQADFKTDANRDVTKPLGLGGCIALGDTEDEDTEMPDITCEKFPDDIAEDDVEPQTIDGDAMGPIPGSHALAFSFGVSASQVQLQKASFFATDDTDSEDIGSERQKKYGAALFQPRMSHLLSKGDDSSWTRHKPTASNVGLFAEKFDDRIHMTDKQNMDSRREKSTLLGLDRRQSKAASISVSSSHMLVPSGLSQEQATPRLIIGSRILHSVVPMEQSLLAKRQHLLMDAGLMNARRFRIGWGPTSALTCLPKWASTIDKDTSGLNDSRYGPLMDPKSALEAKKNLSSAGHRVVFQVPDFFPTHSVANTKAAFEGRLKVQMRNVQNLSQDECPRFFPFSGTKMLRDYAEQAQTEVIKSDTVISSSTLWNLCLALWDDLDTMPQCSESSYVCQQARREALSRWLTECSHDVIETEVLAAGKKGRDSAAGIFSYMTGRQIDEACSHAISNGDLRMALLISQAMGSDEIRQLMRHQLDGWAQTEMDHFIDADRLHICALLAGVLVWNCSNRKQINTCAMLDWKRCFALHLWYQCTPTATISDALASYENSFSGETPYAAAPLPTYLETAGIADDSDRVRDVCYLLLRLYCDRTQPLNFLLNPTSLTSNQLDYSLSWHLMQTLSSLGYNHLPLAFHEYICVSYASQLENLGLWHWAVFVLSHLYDYGSRVQAIRHTLSRHVTLGSADADKESFLIESVSIPPEWIYEFKAYRAKSERNTVAEAWCLLKAKMWNKAHSLVVEQIAPEAIVNGTHESLCDTYFNAMRTEAVPGEIKDWATGGGLFLDYCDMLRRADEYQKDTTASEHDLDTMLDLTKSIGSRLNCWQGHKAVDFACQSEMSRNVARFMMMLVAAKDPTDDEKIRGLTNFVTTMPMPENDRHQFLDHISHALLGTVTSSRRRS